MFLQDRGDLFSAGGNLTDHRFEQFRASSPEEHEYSLEYGRLVLEVPVQGRFGDAHPFRQVLDGQFLDALRGDYADRGCDDFVLPWGKFIHIVNAH